MVRARPWCKEVVDSIPTLNSEHFFSSSFTIAMQPSLTLLMHRRIHLPFHLSYSRKKLFLAQNVHTRHFLTSWLILQLQVVFYVRTDKSFSKIHMHTQETEDRGTQKILVTFGTFPASHVLWFMCMFMHFVFFSL